MLLRPFFLVLMLFLAVQSSFAQNHTYQFSQLNIDNGLSHNQVICIYKDSRGFMWFGTLSGLNRYDGYKFTVFKSDSKDTSSLSDDYISRIVEGPDKKLWIQTKNGYNIYDPLTEKFNRSPQNFLRTIGLPDAVITSIKKDQYGNFWFLYPNIGLYRYDPISKRSTHFSSNGKATGSLYLNDITDFSFNSKGDVWIVYRDGTLERLNPESRQVVYRSGILRSANGARPSDYNLTVDRDNDLWLYTTSTSLGICYVNPDKNIFKHIYKNTRGGHLLSDIVFDVVQDKNGLLWLATDHGGINLINKKDFKVSYLLNRDDDIKSLAQNSITSLYKDDTGIMWAGTYKKGISYFHENIIRFPVFRHIASDAKSLPFDDVNRFAEDASGNLWIGTNGGGLIYYNRKSKSYTRYVHNANNPNSLANDVIVSLFIDHDQKLWVGTYWGGLDCYDGKKFTHYRHDDKNPGSISDDRVWEIMEDSSNRLWVGTLAGGLNRFDRDKNVFQHYGPQQDNTVRSGYISDICEDSDKNIWISGYSGIEVLQNATGKFSTYVHNPKDENSLVHNNVNSVMQDSRGLMWIGTREGLSVFDPGKRKFISFKKENGLPDNTILEVLEDKQNTIWLSTPNGLCSIILKKNGSGYSFKFKNYDETDGLQGRAFNENAAFVTSAGELIFGGANGYNLFKPGNIHLNKSKINLAFTDFQVFNKSVHANESIDNHVILSKSITETRELALNHNENVFSIEFGAINFLNSDKLIHQYILEGFNKQWLNADNKIRKATYTNLDPGEYTFRVRAVNSELPANMSELSLKINILPPFWKSPFAYLLYTLIFFGSLFYIRYRGIQKLKVSFALDQERRDAQRMHELDLMKIKFLTNMSHEFRTPLSLIMAPVEQMLENPGKTDQNYQLQVIKRNARRLLSLVNQLLDFRKLEVHELKLHSKPGDIVEFIREIASSFTDIAERKKIGFLFDSEISQLHISFDHDKIERILFNLLSNAFKFTSAGGHISVLLSISVKQEAVSAEVLEIKVMDTGIGIPAEKLDRVFDRFFQHELPGSILNQGSGIGLSIVKEFVKMHGGDIQVESEPDEGSCFIISLPIPKLTDSVKDVGMPAAMAAVSDKTKEYKKPVVLLVEDNEDFRFYLKDNLKETFQVLEAANGKEGWQKALALHPDLIVSDINMPEMSGTELCQKLKNDARTSHIPVILLTAIAGEAEQVKGLETGANDYVTKPFNFEILLSKIRNLLILQQTLRKTYSKQVDVHFPELNVQSQDELFIANVLKYIDVNILNPNLSVEELSKHMCMSRVSLYKKLLMLTGKSPVEFIRSFRLERAARLFEKTQLNIAEVSYEVGFNTPNYFAKAFKAEFDMVPSEYLNKVRKKTLVEQL